MMQNEMERYKLFQWINMISFVINDITLYLDTHPEDEEAIAYFNHFKELRTQALSDYSCQFGPLTIDSASPKGRWLWATQPMPWEGGCF